MYAKEGGGKGIKTKRMKSTGTLISEYQGKRKTIFFSEGREKGAYMVFG